MPFDDDSSVATVSDLRDRAHSTTSRGVRAIGVSVVDLSPLVGCNVLPLQSHNYFVHLSFLTALLAFQAGCSSPGSSALDASVIDAVPMKDGRAVDARGDDATTDAHAEDIAPTSDATTDALPPGDRAPDLPATDGGLTAPSHRPRTLAPGLRGSCAIVSGGGVRCWSQAPVPLSDGGTIPATTRFTVPDLSDVVELSSGALGAVCARTRSGAVRCWNVTLPEIALPVAAGGAPDAVELSGDDSGTCYRRAGGGLTCWGSLASLLSGSSGSQEMPAAINRFPSDSLSIVAGQLRACAIRADRTVVCMGTGGNGNGTDAPSMAPVVVTGLTDVVEVAPHLDLSCARRSNGDVLCWGSGPVGDGTRVPQLTPVSVGLTGTRGISVGIWGACAITDGGGVACWGGLSLEPRPTVMPGITDVVEVRVGNGGTLARRRDGTVWEVTALGATEVTGI